MPSVLVADDDAHIREVARFALAREGHAVELASDGAAALARIDAGGIDLVVLDVLMPELDGLALCRRLGGRVPIVFLSSRGEEADRVLGLELGADDYLAKPFSPRELCARVAAVLRRAAADRAALEPTPVLALGPLVIDRDRHEVRVVDETSASLRDAARPGGGGPCGRPLPVTATELRLLAVFAQHRGRVLSRAQLIATVYGGDHHVTERTIDTHIRNLRAKLAASGTHVIETVHGVGYRARP